MEKHNHLHGYFLQGEIRLVKQILLGILFQFIFKGNNKIIGFLTETVKLHPIIENSDWLSNLSKHNFANIFPKTEIMSV